MTGSAIDSQIGYATEGTAGTYQAPTRTLEHVSETLKLRKERIESKGIKSGRRGGTGRWAPGRQWVDGPVAHELSAANTGLLLKHALGAVSTSGSGPYTHVFTMGSFVESTLTVQVGRPDTAGTVQPFSYLGCHITKLRVGSKAGEISTLEFDVYGQHEDTGQALAATAYPSAWSPFTFAHAVLTLAGTEYEFEEIDFELDNALATGRHTHRTSNPTRPRISKEAGIRQAGGLIMSEFQSLTAYNRFVNGTEAALSMVWNAGASAQLTVAGNVRFDGDTPNVSGPGILDQGLPFKFLSTTSDAAELTITLVNGDSAP